jgi:hypothetical protein
MSSKLLYVARILGGDLELVRGREILTAKPHQPTQTIKVLHPPHPDSWDEWRLGPPKPRLTRNQAVGIAKLSQIVSVLVIDFVFVKSPNLPAVGHEKSVSIAEPEGFAAPRPKPISHDAFPLNFALILTPLTWGMTIFLPVLLLRRIAQSCRETAESSIRCHSRRCSRRAHRVFV